MVNIDRLRIALLAHSDIVYIMYSRDNATASSTGEMPSMYYFIYLNSLHMKKNCYVSAVC